MVQKWEYKAVEAMEIEGAWFIKELDSLGEDGWELAGIRGSTYIFKRPVVEEFVWPATTYYEVPLV